MIYGEWHLLPASPTLCGFLRATRRSRHSKLRGVPGVPVLEAIVVLTCVGMSRSAFFWERVGCCLGRVGCTGLLGVQCFERRLPPGVDVWPEVLQLWLAPGACLAVDRLQCAPSHAKQCPSTKGKRLTEEGQLAAPWHAGRGMLGAQIGHGLAIRCALPQPP